MSFVDDRALDRESPASFWSRLYRRISARVVRVVTADSDPIVGMRIGRRFLYAPSSHRHQLFRKEHPYYDTALPRLAEFIHRTQGNVILIDVGANIGDSVSLVTDAVPARCLAIEGDETFFRLLVRNVGHLTGVACERAIVSDDDEAVAGKFAHTGGTAHIETGDVGPDNVGLTATTLDRLVQKHSVFARANLLKVDTDGYDHKVIRGAQRLLADARPAVYFELSPWHLRTVGRDEPMAILDVLGRLGYREALFYDNLGYPLAVVDTRDSTLVSQLLEYASRKPYFYFDVLTMHATNEAHFRRFVRTEWDVVARFEWPTHG